jgi:hypothetical protein
MHWQWQLQMGGQDHIVLRNGNATAIQKHFAVPTIRAAWQVSSWFPDWHRDSGATRARLLEFCRGLDVRFGAPINHIETATLRDRVHEAFRSGVFLVVPAKLQGAYRELLPYLAENLKDVPNRRGLYILCHYDTPFYAGLASKDLHAVLEHHLEKRTNREIAAVDPKTVQYEYYCPQSATESEAQMVKPLDPDSYGSLRLNPDPTIPPPACVAEECTCRNYDDSARKGPPLIRALQANHANCSCGHPYSAHK